MYKKSKQEENIVGILYSAIQSYGFHELNSINFYEFTDTIMIDMMYLKSKLTDDGYIDTGLNRYKLTSKYWWCEMTDPVE